MPYCFKTLSVGPVWELEPETSRTVVRRSINWGDRSAVESCNAEPPWMNCLCVTWLNLLADILNFCWKLVRFNQSGNKCQVIARSLLCQATEPEAFVPGVAKQHDVLVRTIASGVLVSARARFWLDEIIRNIFEYSTKICQNWHLLPRL